VVVVVVVVVVIVLVVVVVVVVIVVVDVVASAAAITSVYDFHFCHLANGEGIVVIGVCLSVFLSVMLVTVCDASSARTSLSTTQQLQLHHIHVCGEGDALYPVLCSWRCFCSLTGSFYLRWNGRKY